MKRRTFIACLGRAVAWPVVARAQQPDRMRRIGALMDRVATDTTRQSLLAGFVQALRQLGWTESQKTFAGALVTPRSHEPTRRS